MATAVSAWGKPGAWALDSEEHEAQLHPQQKEENTKHQSNGGGAEADFPSLAVASTTKTKKKHPQTLSLQEFISYGADKQSNTIAASSKGLTAEEMMMLPTAPRQRTAEELERTKLGGGFRSYDTRPSRGSSDGPRRQGSFNRDMAASSRADEIDNWVSTKKSVGNNGFEMRERGGGLFSGSQSRADEVDNWTSNKGFVPTESRKYDRRVGFELNGGRADSDNWVKRKEEEGKKFGGSFDSLRARRGSNESTNSVDSDNWGRKREEGSNGVASARPKLNLNPRTLPVIQVPEKENTPNPLKPKGSNPFGEARPREEVLKEKGQDWKEIDEKLENVKIKQLDSPGPKQRGFGSSDERAYLPEDRTERAWRKPECVEARPSSSEKSENGNHVEESQDNESSRVDSEL